MSGRRRAATTCGGASGESGGRPAVHLPLARPPRTVVTLGAWDLDQVPDLTTLSLEISAVLRLGAPGVGRLEDAVLVEQVCMVARELVETLVQHGCGPVLLTVGVTASSYILDAEVTTASRFFDRRGPCGEGARLVFTPILTSSFGQVALGARRRAWALFDRA